ncbi:MAG: tetratricopeptide repeat protein [Thermoanaerobaculia bacterium]
MPRPPSGFGTRDVARLLGLRQARVQAWAREGLVHVGRNARGDFRFTFRDVVLLRTAKELLDSGLTTHKVRTALDALREQLPAGRALSGVRVAAAGGEVVAKSNDEAWEPVSGQRLLDFQVAELAEAVRPLARQAVEEARESEEELDAEAWFELALELEVAAPAEAIEAYHRTLEIDPEHADAHLNLGRLLHEQGEVSSAETHYRRALALRPDDATAAFNLGVALQDRKRWRAAVVAYRRAVEIDPGYADAFYNLAAVYAKLGDRALGIQNLKTYKELVED